MTDSGNIGFPPPGSTGDAISWLQLIRSRRVGAATFGRLMREHGNADAALDALPGVARAAGVDDYTPCSRADAQREYEAGCRLGARLLCLGTAAYPAALAAISDPPPLLWSMGRSECALSPAIALVGARNASSLGLRTTRMLARGLGEAGLIIVSGLARGIDTAAHLTALDSGTIAVMAGGVDRIYPAENRDLAARIRDTGLLLSEQPIGMQPQARHFPRRNRIIAALARAVVVIEGAAKSGSLITAAEAADLGREVMAVPGHPLDARAGGCNMLIRDGATLVRSAGDVIEALAPDGVAASRGATPPTRRDPCDTAPGATTRRRHVGRTRPSDHPQARENGKPPDTRGKGSSRPARHTAPPRKTPPRKATSGEALDLSRRILSLLGPSPVSEDHLIRELALPPAQVTPRLVLLELEGKLARQAGGMLSRIG